LRPDRDGGGHDVQRRGAGGEHELQLSGAGDGRGGERERVLERGERDDAGDACGAGGGVGVQRGERDDGRGRLGQQQHGDAERGDVDDGGAVRERAGVRRDDREGDGAERGVARADDGDDAGGVGVPDGGADGVAGGDRQERGRVLPDGVVGSGQPASDGRGVAAGRADYAWADGAGAEHVDASGGDVRRGDDAAVRERGGGGEPGADGGADADGGDAADRGGQLHGGEFRGADRRGADLQPGAECGRDSDGHEHRSGWSAAVRHDTADGAEQSDGDGGEREPDQSELDGVDGRRGGDGVSGGAVPRGGVYELRTDRDGGRPDVQRHGAGGEHELHLSDAGDGCGGEPERVLERGEHDDAGRGGHAGADGAEQSDGDGDERGPDQSELDGVDGRRGGDGVPGGAVPGGGVHGLRADRDGGGRDVQRH